MSHILSQIIKKKLPAWNEIVFSESELFKACDLTGANVVELDIKAQGEYVIHDGIPFVILKKGLKEPLRLWVGLHELGHHLLHYPLTHKFSRGTYSRVDREANFFTAIAMMPTWLVKSKSLSEIMADYNYPKKIMEIRREICENFQI
jgi:Zn-dependent peptidase ImmA (M78 family)